LLFCPASLRDDEFADEVDQLIDLLHRHAKRGASSAVAGAFQPGRARHGADCSVTAGVESEVTAACVDGAQARFRRSRSRVPALPLSVRPCAFVKP